MKRLLLALLFVAGCQSQTSVYSPRTGKPTFRTNATFERLELRADGSVIMIKGDHAAMQKELAATLAARGTAFAGIITALLAANFIH